MKSKLFAVALCALLLCACGAQSSSGGFAAQHCFEGSTGYEVSILQTNASVRQDMVALTLSDGTVRDVPLFCAQLTAGKQLTMCVASAAPSLSPDQIAEWTVAAAENGWSLGEAALTAPLASYWQTDSEGSLAYHLTAPGAACFSVERDGTIDYWIVLLDTPGT